MSERTDIVEGSCDVCGVNTTTFNTSRDKDLCSECKKAVDIGFQGGLASCAAGPWDYDMDSAPKDEQDNLMGIIELLPTQFIWHHFYWNKIKQCWEMEYFGDIHEVQLIAWAKINLPEEKE